MPPKMLEIWFCRYFGQSKGSSASVELPAAPKPRLKDILKAARKEYPKTVGGHEAPAIIMLHHDRAQSDDANDVSKRLDPSDVYDARRHGGRSGQCPIVFRILTEPKLNHIPPSPAAAAPPPSAPVVPPAAVESTMEVAVAVPTTATTKGKRVSLNVATKRAPPKLQSMREVAGQGQRNGATARYPSRDRGATAPAPTTATTKARPNTDNVLVSQLSSKKRASKSQTSPTKAAVAVAAAASVPRNKRNQIIVYCGSKHNTAPGNQAYYGIIRTRVTEYLKASFLEKSSILDELAKQFEFQLEDGKGPMDVRGARDKIKKRMLQTNQSLPLAAATASSSSALASGTRNINTDSGRSNHSSKSGKKKIVVQCGFGTINAAFTAAVASCAAEYDKAPRDKRKSMLDGFMDRFEFRQGSKRVAEKFGRSKVSLAIANLLAASKKRKRPAPAAAAADDEREATTASVAMPPKKRTKQAPHRLPAQKGAGEAGDEEN